MRSDKSGTRPRNWPFKQDIQSDQLMNPVFKPVGKNGFDLPTNRQPDDPASDPGRDAGSVTGAQAKVEKGQIEDQQHDAHQRPVPT